MTKPPVKLPQQDQQLFSEAVSGITPLHQDKIIPSTDNNNRIFVTQSNYIDDKNEIVDRLSDEYDPFGDLQSNDQQRNDLNYHHSSISKKQFQSLKKGQFQGDLILDLHGHSRQQARNELLEFLQYCHQHDFRQVAIMPGRGYGVLRQALNIWLRQLPEILAFAESPQHAGGKGVIRILLRAN